MMPRLALTLLGMGLLATSAAHPLTWQQKSQALQKELDTLEESTFHEDLALMMLVDQETILDRIATMDKESLAYYLPLWQRIATLFQDAAHHEEVEETESALFTHKVVRPLEKVIQAAQERLKKRTYISPKKALPSLEKKDAKEESPLEAVNTTSQKSPRAHALSKTKTSSAARHQLKAKATAKKPLAATSKKAAKVVSPDNDA